jgi:hypothetical protein
VYKRQAVSRFISDPFRDFPKAFRKGFSEVEVVGNLFVIHLKSVFFEHLPVIRVVVLHPETGPGIAFYQQSPKVVVLPEIDRTIHRFHLALLQPLAASFKEFKSRFLVIDTLKEAHPACGLVVAPGFLVIDEGSYPSDMPSGIVFQDPAHGLPVVKKRILTRGKNALNKGVRDTYPVFITAINIAGHLVKSLAARLVINLNQFHFICFAAESAISFCCLQRYSCNLNLPECPACK